MESGKGTRQSEAPAAHRCFRGAALLGCAALFAAIAGCGTTSTGSIARLPDGTAAPPAEGGGYYLDDGPGANPPPDLAHIPDAVPRIEPLNRGAMRPYVVMGHTYTPMTALAPYHAEGIATWYGRRYHGKRTSTGEIYDMYAMTAAHPTLPLPSYVRVTNPANGKSVVVRVNDRGPFIDGRLIDLSYAAAYRLGLIADGSGMVEVDAIIPGAPAPAQTVAAEGRPAAAQTEPGATPLPGPLPEAPQAAAVAAIPAATVAEPTLQTPGIYLQLGAFGSRANAENYLARAKLELGTLPQTLSIVDGDGLHRVHVGPYASESAARQAASHIGQVLGVRPVLQRP